MAQEIKLRLNGPGRMW